MIFTKRQLKDLETIEYFIPKEYLKYTITDEDRKMYFEWSEKGMHKEGRQTAMPEINGLWILQEGKRWRGIHIHELWEQGILDRSVPYWVLLGGEDGEEIMPRSVVNFMKKEMFKGYDAELIEKVYQLIHSKKHEEKN